MDRAARPQSGVIEMIPSKAHSYLATAVLLLTAIAACQRGATADEGGVWVPEIVAQYPHDSSAFTQGLLFHDGKLLESTGLERQSSLRRVDIATGRVEQRRDLAGQYFAEGLALVGNRLYQLTWKNNEAIVYDLDDFRELETFRYDGEGWGLTYDGSSLIMSDGTSSLRFIDPENFRVLRTVTVTVDGSPLVYLNELEYIDGEVWANIWFDDRVARIDPDDGHVIGWVDLSQLYPADRRPRDAVVNGIAWDPESDRIFATGKLWRAIFEIEFRERD
jgi:glutamine cyclotransferase